MQIYTYPFLLEQDEPSIKVAIRNSFAVFVKFMGRSIVTLLSFLVLSVISVFLTSTYWCAHDEHHYLFFELANSQRDLRVKGGSTK